LSETTQSLYSAITNLNEVLLFFVSQPKCLEFVEQEDADETGDVLTVKVKVREFKPQKPFCVQWDGAALFNVSGHNPSKLKGKDGRPSEYTISTIQKVLLESGRRLEKTELRDLCACSKYVAQKISKHLRVETTLLLHIRMRLSFLDDQCVDSHAAKVSPDYREYAVSNFL
jgi:hypothetical protein